jgi:hypothetical protein
MFQKMTQWLFGRRLFSRRPEKIQITVETCETWDVQWFRQSRIELCPICGAETVFIPPPQAAQIVQFDAAELERFLANGNVHFKQTPENERLICLDSLKRTLEHNSTRRFPTEK